MQKIDLFLAKEKVIGIIKIENMITGKILLFKSKDVVKDLSKIRFELDLGMFYNQDLQEDYEKTGLELFDISLESECSKPDELDSLLFERTEYYKSINSSLYLEE